VERVARLASLAAFAGAGVGFLIMGFATSPAAANGGLATLLTFGLGGVGAGIIAARRYEQRRDVAGERWNKFWNSRLGRWAVKLAGIGLKRGPAQAVTYRKTELVLGLAADRLYEALPRSLKQQLKELPGTVRQLEHDAQRMRARVEQLNALIGEVGGDAPSNTLLAAGRGESEGRDQLVADLRMARDAAQQRLADAVAALEAIRLDLLRMQAGTSTVEGITANLSAAREISEEIERLLEGQREVERALGNG
jgi:serine/threonine-protein kinase